MDLETGEMKLEIKPFSLDDDDSSFGLNSTFSNSPDRSFLPTVVKPTFFAWKITTRMCARRLALQALELSIKSYAM